MRDPVTHLFNRQHFLRILEGQVNTANEHKVTMALLVIDIHNFKRINHIYGFKSGDIVLQSVAQILEQIKREYDQIARIGDNRFAIVLTGIMNNGHAQLAAHKIQRLFDIPFQLENENIRCSATIGIAICPNHASQHEHLLMEAENAIEHAKQLGEPVGFAEKQIDEGISETWDIEIELEDAIKNSELRVYFQPKISLHTNKPIGAEALIRWDSPSRGLLPPHIFLPVAETSGFLKPLTEWVLNSALRLSNEWTTQWGKLDVSINIPPKILERPDFSDIVLSSRDLWKPHHTLCLEILEQSFTQNTNAIFLKLKELCHDEIKISIDDFGTGYSSLSYFRDIPANQLKIDRSFVSGLLNDKANENIVGLIINLAHRFNLEVVAEGVENIETLRILKTMGCDIVQGYLYSKPIPASTFHEWLKHYRGLQSCTPY